MANKTNGLQDGKEKNIVIYTEDNVYFVHADRYLSGEIERIDVADEIPNAKEYAHALRDNDIHHVKNSHGEDTDEKYPVTREDQKLIPYIAENYDKVFVKYIGNGKPGIVYVKVTPENLVYYLESVTDEYGNEKLLVNKQMIKTGLSDVPNLVGLHEAITKNRL